MSIRTSPRRDPPSKRYTRTGSSSPTESDSEMDPERCSCTTRLSSGSRPSGGLTSKRKPFPRGHWRWAKTCGECWMLFIPSPVHSTQWNWRCPGFWFWGFSVGFSYEFQLLICGYTCRASDCGNWTKDPAIVKGRPVEDYRDGHPDGCDGYIACRVAVQFARHGTAVGPDCSSTVGGWVWCEVIGPCKTAQRQLARAYLCNF